MFHLIWLCNKVIFNRESIANVLWVFDHSCFGYGLLVVQKYRNKNAAFFLLVINGTTHPIVFKVLKLNFYFSFLLTNFLFYNKI
jgi:hypothetical protein